MLVGEFSPFQRRCPYPGRLATSRGKSGKNGAQKKPRVRKARAVSINCYSSLSQLKKFKVYKLKIDQSSVRDISTDPEDKAIVSAIINMAKSLGLKTLAEGVETAGQRAFLREQGCDEIQGYFYCRPVPADQFEAFARSIV